MCFGGSLEGRGPGKVAVANRIRALRRRSWSKASANFEATQKNVEKEMPDWVAAGPDEEIAPLRPVQASMACA